MERRAFVLGIGAALSLRSTHARASSEFVEMEAQLGGRIGVAAVDTGSGAHLAHRGDERFAMCSTFKWLLAAAVLHKADIGETNLDQRLSYGTADLLDVSPVTAAHVGDGALTIKSLCEAAVEVSDNAAANVLLRYIGGPRALTAFLRGIGDPTTRLDRFELSLNTNLPKDSRDTTTPGAMIATMQKVLLGNVLAADSSDLLVTWLKNCQTGLHRIRAGLPATWAAGDKTGTGQHGAANDNAIIWPPQRPPLVVAAYMSGSRADLDTLNAAHARIGRILAEKFSSG